MAAGLRCVRMRWLPLAALGFSLSEETEEVTVLVRLGVSGEMLGELVLAATDSVSALLHAVATLMGPAALSEGICGLHLLREGRLLRPESYQSLTSAGLRNRAVVDVVRHRGLPVATASFDHTAKIWNTETGLCELTLSGHLDAVTCIAVAPDGLTMATSSHDFMVKLWSASTGECQMTLPG
ncbi:unnamed protein product [Polarella glacialis]|uniref:Uncharacterized protein n=1 Tax=Polarella glacialis TaxID=89957 RepID=A0A813LRH3_POLGL|nr:unnamed protein product [Polarella glacialis]